MPGSQAAQSTAGAVVARKSMVETSDSSSATRLNGLIGARGDWSDNHVEGVGRIWSSPPRFALGRAPLGAGGHDGNRGEHVARGDPIVVGDRAERGVALDARWDVRDARAGAVAADIIAGGDAT
jgi:hypothetical protein